MIDIYNYLGNWPEETKEARDKKLMILIPKEKALRVIHGRENKSLMRFFISNDRIHVGTLIINGGKMTDAESHHGDEIFRVLKGDIQLKILNDDDPGNAVFQDCFFIRRGQVFLIPEGYKHQYFNLAKESAEILFAIAPGL